MVKKKDIENIITNIIIKCSSRDTHLNNFNYNKTSVTIPDYVQEYIDLFNNNPKEFRKKFNRDAEDIFEKQDKAQQKIKYTNDEVNGISKYGHGAYAPMNTKLYNPKKYEKEYIISNNYDDGYVTKWINDMDKAIKKSDGMIENSISYRYGHWRKSWKKGKLEGYTSTSHSIDEASYFSGKKGAWQLNFYILKGTECISLTDTFTGLSHEMETCLGRGVNYYTLKSDNDLKTASVIVWSDE